MKHIAEPGLHPATHQSELQGVAVFQLLGFPGSTFSVQWAIDQVVQHEMICGRNLPWVCLSHPSTDPI